MLQAQCDPATCQLYLTDQELKRERKVYNNAVANMRDIPKDIREKKSEVCIFGIFRSKKLTKL